MDAALGLAPLTPLAQLDRAADYFPDRTAYRFEGASTSYAELRDQGILTEDEFAAQKAKILGS